MPKNELKALPHYLIVASADYFKRPELEGMTGTVVGHPELAAKKLGVYAFNAASIAETPAMVDFLVLTLEEVMKQIRSIEDSAERNEIAQTQLNMQAIQLSLTHSDCKHDLPDELQIFFEQNSDALKGLKVDPKNSIYLISSAYKI